MSKPASFDREAPKQTVSLTINSDLYAQAKRLGMNASKIAEEAPRSSTRAAPTMWSRVHYSRSAIR